MMLHQININLKTNSHLLITKAEMPFHLKILITKDSNNSKYTKEICNTNSNNSINNK